MVYIILDEKIKEYHEKNKEKGAKIKLELNDNNSEEKVDADMILD